MSRSPAGTVEKSGHLLSHHSKLELACMAGVDLLSWASFQPVWSFLCSWSMQLDALGLGRRWGGGRAEGGGRSISRDVDNALQKIFYSI